jgi:cellulose synthase/poly-beta-1,6-N-acetylglucosamine synthase-like glycosyltransferase
MGSGTEGLYPTCNMLYRRSAFEAAGGFDASIAAKWGWRLDCRTRGDGFGEDTLLAWRVIRSGLRLDYCPEALVLHAVFPPDPLETLSRTLRVGGFPAMVREVPELRDTLFRHRWQLGARTRVPMYAAAVAMAARRPAAAGACSLWWAGLRWKELRRYPASRRRRLAAFPVELGIDVLTGSALIAGSIRARSAVF